MSPPALKAAIPIGISCNIRRRPGSALTGATVTGSRPICSTLPYAANSRPQTSGAVGPSLSPRKPSPVIGSKTKATITQPAAANASASGGRAQGSAENSQSNDHADDEACLLDDFARVLEGIDEEPEDEARHHREDGLLQQLWEWGGADERFGQIHQCHQQQSGDHASAETAYHGSSPAHRAKLLQAGYTRVTWLPSANSAQASSTLSLSEGGPTCAGPRVLPS